MTRAAVCLLALITMPIGIVADPPGQPDEIVFAVRQPGVGGNWHKKFGYYAQDEHAKAYRARQHAENPG